MRPLRLVVLVAVMLLVVAAVGSGAVLPTPAVAQAPSPSGLCDSEGISQFGDVGDSDYGAAYILCMRALGLSQGRGDGGYGPDGELNRGQMASFLIRLWTDHLGQQCPSGVVVPFTDTAGTTHEANIECLFGLGITQGASATTYGPQDPLKASQISRFLYRTYQKAGGDQCQTTAGSELARASECLFNLRVVPSTAEATAGTPVIRSQMGVYVIGLWHNLTGKGLPPTPPELAATTTTNTTTESDAGGGDAVTATLQEIPQTFVDVAVGYEHACAVRSDLSVTCWGNNADVTISGHTSGYGRADPPDGRFKAVAAAQYGSCGIRTDGSLSCWGRFDAPEGLYQSVSAGDYHMCAVKVAGDVVCWSSKVEHWWQVENEYGQASPPEGTFLFVAAGTKHSCAVGSDQSVVCWGSDEYGQASPPEGTFLTVAAGSRHSCAVRSDQSVVCWGSNEFDQVAAPDGRFEDVVAGREHSCALATDEAIVCWGKPGDRATWKPSGRFRLIAGGLIGNCAVRTDGTIVCWGNFSRPIINREAPSSGWTEVTTRGSARCVRRLDGIVACWRQGANLLEGSAVQVFRDGSRSTHDALNEVVPLGRPDVGYRDVAGGAISCGLKTDHTATCWGTPAFGRLDVPEGQFQSIAVGRLHSCGLRFDGTVECWGISTGEPTILQSKWAHWIPGFGSHGDYSGQFDVPEGRYTAIAAGRDHTCGIRTDKSLACWGNTSAIKDTPSSGTFKVVAALDSTCAIHENGSLDCWGGRLSRVDTPQGAFTDIDVGFANACGIKEGGRVVCWSMSTGPGISGRQRLTFLNAPAGEYRQVILHAAGYDACALRTDTSVICWNLYGTYNAETIPGQFTALSRSCAVRTDGSVTCWGSNSYGNLEVPFDPVATPPQSVPGSAADPEPSSPPDTRTTITAGKEFSCALRADGTVSCWGGRIAFRAPDDDRWRSGFPGFYPGIPTGQFLSISGYNEGEHACGIRLDKSIACWGSNHQGVLEAPSGEFNMVSAGYRHSCGVRTDGTIICWGALGRVGGGSRIVDPPPGTYIAVSSGHDYSCGIRTDRSIVCWGALEGQDAKLLDPPAGQFTAVSTGRVHACGLRTDRTITCWSAGEPPNQADALAPAIRNWGQLDVPAGQYVSVDVAYEYSCGLRIDGVTVCWGSGISAGRIDRDFISIAVGYGHLCGIRAEGTADCIGFRGCQGFLDRGQFDAPSDLFLT